MKKFLFAFAAVVTLFLSCKKDDEPATVAVTKETISGNYKITAITLKQGTTEQSYIDSFLLKCSQDDVLNFKSDKTYTQTDAGVKCSPSENSDGTWDLPATNKFIWDDDLFDLDKFDGKTLEISYTFGVNAQNQIVALVFKFQKQ